MSTVKCMAIGVPHRWPTISAGETDLWLSMLFRVWAREGELRSIIPVAV